MANSFKKSLKHTLRNWPANFSHLVKAAGEMALFAVGITAPLTLFVVYPAVAAWNRYQRWRK